MTSMLLEQLKYSRHNHGISQSEMADLLHLSQSNFSRIENGKVKADTDILEQYADKVGLKLGLMEKKPVKTKTNYELRLFDIPLLKFCFLQNFGSPLSVELVWVDKNKTDLLPVDLELDGQLMIKWLQRRIIPKNRTHVFEILHSLQLEENDLKGIIDVCMGLSVNDSFWIVKEGFNGTFAQYNLYENHFNEALGLVAYTGHQSEIRAFSTSPELTTNGMLPKAWRLKEGELVLYKGGTEGSSNSGREPYCEAYASQIGELMGLDIVPYHLEKWKGKLASVCPAFSSCSVSYMPAGRIIKTGGMDAAADYCRQLGEDFYQAFCSMVVFDALIVNEDRHFGNFGFLLEAKTNKIISFAPLFDHGLSLLAQIPRSQMGSIDSVFEYSLTRRNCEGVRFFELAASYIGPVQKKQLRKIIDFHFKDEAFNFPKRYLKRLEKTIQKRARLLLQLPTVNKA